MPNHEAGTVCQRHKRRSVRTPVHVIQYEYRLCAPGSNAAALNQHVVDAAGSLMPYISPGLHLPMLAKQVSTNTGNGDGHNATNNGSDDDDSGGGDSSNGLLRPNRPLEWPTGSPSSLRRSSLRLGRVTIRRRGLWRPQQRQKQAFSSFSSLIWVTKRDHRIIRITLSR
jgi:hypothetical protein